MVIGLKRNIVILAPYTPEWAKLFVEEKNLLQTLIGKYVMDIQHIGSTSIPEMIAKPIIDIGISIVEFEKGKECIKLIESLGYKYKGENEIPRRHYFVKGDTRTHHIHMLEYNSEEWKNHIIFRDFLIKNPQIAKKYIQLKKELAKKFRNDRLSYSNGKSEFIEHILMMAKTRIGYKIHK